MLHVQAPVSGAEAAQRVLTIRDFYLLEAKFEDGSTARFRPESADDSGINGTLEWRRPGEKKLQEGVEAKAKELAEEAAKQGPQGALRCGEWRFSAGAGSFEGEASCQGSEASRVTGTLRAVAK